ncbi:Nucleolar Complex 2 protein [Bachmanniomyces sp. S44760]|nr:Nucleolar Complex 2 protein [Bachmanniomyces sp. S44760]
MAKHSKKATRKFEKNHLKDVIEKRKDFAKIKQRQQIKAKRQARRASDYAKAPDIEDEELASKAASKRKDDGPALKDMTVDEFFQGGFEVPQLKQKRKSGGKTIGEEPSAKKQKGAMADGDVYDDASPQAESSEENDVIESDEEATSDEEGLDAHRGELDALAEKDPDFYKYLKDNDAELLDFDDQGGLADFDGLSDTDDPPKKKEKGKGQEKAPVGEGEGAAEDGDETEVTDSMVVKWEKAMKEQYSLRAMRQVVLAFRAAVHVNEDTGKEYKYSISSPDVYHQLLVVALSQVPEVLQHHLPVKETAGGKVRVATDSKKFRTLTPLLKSHTTSIQHLLENLSDASTFKLTLSSILPLLPYLLSFKKALKNLVKATIDIWSDTSNGEATRINAFMLIRRLAIISDASLREAILKATYQGLVKGSRNTTIHTLPGINLMKNSAAELWGLDASIGYTTGFTYIRQLAIHLRGSITQPTKDSYKTIYNWQYTHSLDFWSRVLSFHCSTMTQPLLKKPHDSPLHPLIYPLVQITLGALRLIPTPTYFPLRFHLTRSLLRISRQTNTYIPLAASLLEVLSSPELKRPPKPSTLKPLDFTTSIRAPKSYLRTRIYQDGAGEQVAELLAEFFGVWAKSIAFPELCIPASVLLKRWLKEVSSNPKSGHGKGGTKKTGKDGGKGNKNSKLTSSITLVVSKMAANATWIEERRRKVDFAPSDRSAVEAFLRDVPWEDTPLGAYVVGMRGQKEARERVIEEGRRAEEERREREKRGGDEAAGSEDGSESEDAGRLGLEEEDDDEEMDD